MYDKGLVGTDDFKSVAELISYNIDSSTESFKKNYDKLQRYFTEDDDGNLTSGGVNNFLEDLKSLNKGYAEFDKNTGKWTLNMDNTAQAAKDISDELGYQPIKTTIKLTDGGDLSITNTFTGEITMVKNCVKGEKIVFDSENLIITSNVEHKRLYNDFNYIYPRLFTDYRNSTNTIETSISCAILVEYRPIRKVGVVV